MSLASVMSARGSSPFSNDSRKLFISTLKNKDMEIYSTILFISTNLCPGHSENALVVKSIQVNDPDTALDNLRDVLVAALKIFL